MLKFIVLILFQFFSNVSDHLIFITLIWNIFWLSKNLRFQSVSKNHFKECWMMLQLKDFSIKQGEAMDDFRFSESLVSFQKKVGTT